VRAGTSAHSLDGTISYKPGDEFTLPANEAADFLRGKNRRGFEVVEIFDDPEEPGSERNDSRSG
jgi:hypothetical protein